MSIAYRKIITALLCLTGFTASAIAGFFCWPFFVCAALFVVGYLYIDKKYLRCPHCGGFENLDRLLYAAMHEYHCRHCGHTLEIKK